MAKRKKVVRTAERKYPQRWAKIVKIAELKVNASLGLFLSQRSYNAALEKINAMPMEVI